MNIYFSGLGGVGIGPLVEIALDAGYQVQGSDLYDSLQTNELRQRGVQMIIGAQDGDFLRNCHETKPIDLFVHTAALKSDHQELITAKQLGIPTTKRDGFINTLIKDKGLKLIAVSGTHGKTTTTGMLIWVFKQLGIPVSYSIGTTLSFGPNGRFDEDSQYFIYEADEFDRNMLRYYPFLAILPAIDYDHPDTYPSAESYSQAFAQFINQSDHTILWKVDNDTVINNTSKNIWSLGQNEVMDFKLPGMHNRRNATLVIKAIEYLGLDLAKAKKALDQFPGTDRRFEKLAENLYTDYGHHPVEIASTLQLAREISPHVVLVYQPHQNIRQHEIRDMYKDQFELAEKIYWLPTYLSREDPDLAILTPEELSKNLTNQDAVEVADMNEDLWNKINNDRLSGKLVVCLSAGTLDGWLRERVART